MSTPVLGPRRRAAAGRHQARRGRGHVRPPRAALRPHEPRDLARPRPALAPAHRRRARRRPPARACSTSRAAPATCAATSRRVGCTPVGVDFSAGMLAAARDDAPLRARRRRRAPVRRRRASTALTCGFALRNFVDLDVVFRECARVLRPGGRFAAARRHRARPTRSCGPGNAVWFRGAVPLLGRVLAHDAEAYRYLPKSHGLPPAAPRARRPPRPRRLPRRRVHTSLTGGSVLLLTGTRAMTTTDGTSTRAARGHPRDRRRPTTARRLSSPADFAWLHHHTRLVTAGRRGTRRARRRRRRRSPRSTSTTRSGCPAPVRSRSARCPSTPTAARRARDPGAGVRRGRRPRAGSPRSAPPRRDVDPRAVAARRRFTVVAPRSRARMGHRRRARARRRSRAATSRRSCSPARCSIEADTPFDAASTCSRRLVAQQPGCFVYASDGLRRREPRAARAPHRRRSSSRARSPAPTVADSDDALRALAASVKDTQRAPLRGRRHRRRPRARLPRPRRRP